MHHIPANVGEAALTDEISIYEKDYNARRVRGPTDERDRRGSLAQGSTAGAALPARRSSIAAGLSHSSVST